MIRKEEGKEGRRGRKKRRKINLDQKMTKVYVVPTSVEYFLKLCFPTFSKRNCFPTSITS